RDRRPSPCRGSDPDASPPRASWSSAQRDAPSSARRVAPCRRGAVPGPLQPSQSTLVRETSALALGTELLELEDALDPAERIVVDDATLAQVARGAALGLDELASDLRVLEQLLLGRARLGALE